MSKTINFSNKKDREEFRSDPHKFLSYLNNNIDIVVKTNTKNKMYMVFDKNQLIDLKNIQVAGGTHTSSIGTASSTSSLSTIVTFSSALSFSTASTYIP